MNITKQQITDVLSSKGFAVAVTAVVAGAGGYYVATQRLKGEYERLMAEETEGLRIYFQSVQEKPEPEELTKKYDTTEDDIKDAGAALLETYVEKVQNYSSYSEEKEEPEPEEVDPVKELNALNNIFDEAGLNGTDFDMEVELERRDTNHPYIISYEEWIADDLGHDQISITYYEVDDVLVDDRDIPVDDIHGNIGARALENFGYGSKDASIVYVRNENRSMDYEVVRNSGSFSETVLGFKHSDARKGVLKFRGDDE